jgi:hypothetical protein
MTFRVPAIGAASPWFRLLLPKHLFLSHHHHPKLFKDGTGSSTCRSSPAAVGKSKI